MAQKDRAEVRRAVHKRIRRKVSGSAQRPRLTIYRSLNHIYAQIIDDEQGRTIAAASTAEKDLRGATGGNIDAATRVGRAIAERALSNGIESVVFDRGGYRYHGGVTARGARRTRCPAHPRRPCDSRARFVERHRERRLRPRRLSLSRAREGSGRR